MLRPLLRSGLAALTLAATLAAALAVPPAAGLAAPQAAPTAPAPATGAMNWTPCRDGFQCATVQVPLDYDRPAGPEVDLALIRLPAGDPAHRIGSLLVNPGGPGGSGVDIVRGVGLYLPLELRARYDVVGFDPRGILRSTPLRCYDTFDQAIAGLPPFAFPFTREEENELRDSDRAFGAACAAHGGPILGHMSTADVARDMDHLRALSGDKYLNFLGFSYGSYLGQVYANMFPDRVGRMVIDGVLDPVAWSTGRGYEARTTPFTTRLRSAQGAQDTLEEFFRQCDAAGAECLFAGHAAQRFATLAGKLREAPFVLGDPPDTFTFSYADLVSITLGGLYGSAFWPDLAAFLAYVEDLGRPGAVERVRASMATVRARLGLDKQAQEPYDNYVEGFPGVGCSDSVNPGSFDAWRRAAAGAEGYFGQLWTWISSTCLPWPKTAGQDRYLGPWNRRTANPVLIVGNRFDPATPYHGALTAHRLLPGSALLTYTGAGHTAYLLGNFCVDSAVTTYLVTGRTPAPPAVCQPQGAPFEQLPPTAMAQAKAAARVAVPMLPPGAREAIRR